MRSYISADFLGAVRGPGPVAPNGPRAKRQRFFRPVSRRKTAAFDLTTLWCYASARRSGAGSIFDVATDAVPICCSLGASPAPRRAQDAVDISARVRDDSPLSL